MAESSLPEDPIKQAQRQRAIAWLNSHWTRDQTCPIDGRNNWTVSDVIELRPFAGGGLVVGASVYPMFQVICTTCGYTLLFNAAISGVVEQPPPTTPEQQSSEGTP
jgi:hypothetical protein